MHNSIMENEIMVSDWLVVSILKMSISPKRNYNEKKSCLCSTGKRPTKFHLDFRRNRCAQSPFSIGVFWHHIGFEFSHDAFCKFLAFCILSMSTCPHGQELILYQEVTRHNTFGERRPNIEIWAGGRRRRLGANPVLGNDKKWWIWASAAKSENMGREAAEAVRS